MKFFKQGDRKSALCHRDGRVMTTFAYRNVPFRDGRGVAENVLVGTCDVCGDAVIIPPQSSPAIAASRSKLDRTLEVRIPATFVDALDAAIVRVAVHATPDFRKQLLVYYVNRYSSGEEKIGELAELTSRYVSFSPAGPVPSRRLSMKLNEATDVRIERVRAEANLSKTDLVKSIILKIFDDVVEPVHPKHQKELSQMADVLYA